MEVLIIIILITLQIIYKIVYKKFFKTLWKTLKAFIFSAFSKVRIVFKSQNYHKDKAWTEKETRYNSTNERFH